MGLSEPTQFGWLGGAKMNPYKVRAVLELIRQHSNVLVDQFGNTLGPDEIVALLELDEVLSPVELLMVLRNIEPIIEVQQAIDHIKANMP